jgi:hypothetical protein
MMYAVETGSDAAIHIQSFIQIGSTVQTLIEEGYIDSIVIT